MHTLQALAAERRSKIFSYIGVSLIEKVSILLVENF